MRIPILAAALAALAAPSAAQAPENAPLPETVVLSFIDRDGQAVGGGLLAEEAGGVRLTMQLHSMPPGEHALRIHDGGFCDPPEFGSAGEPLTTGDEEPTLEPIEVNDSGVTNVIRMLDDVSLRRGENALTEETDNTMIIHSGTEPGEGDRLACALIGDRPTP